MNLKLIMTMILLSEKNHNVDNLKNILIHKQYVILGEFATQTELPAELILFNAKFKCD